MSGKRSKGSQRRSKKPKCSPLECKLNPLITEEKSGLAEKLLRHKDDRRAFKDENVELMTTPFNVVTIDNFIEDDVFIDTLADELFDLELNCKNNDLYKFSQSNDMRNCDTPAIRGVTEVFETKMRAFLRKATGIDLNGEISMSYSKYAYTDVLLCHDDELEGRRIAYIYYLVSPSWSADDGGALDIFTVDDKTGEPCEIVRSLVPKRNRFLFFEVTPASFHQVAEVISEDKIRHSLVGWFNGPPFERPPHHEEAPIETEKQGDVEEELLRAWINPLYLSEQVETEIQERFCDDSQVQLDCFLNEEKYEKVCDAMNSYNQWREEGPFNRRRTFSMKSGEAPEIIKELISVMTSEAMYLILSNMTGLPLHPMGKVDKDDEDEETEPPDPRHRFKIRDWRHGTYTLVHDDMQDLHRWTLDLNLYFNCEEWKPEFGGFTSYICDEDELLTVTPKPNSLSLVYREDGVLKFVKHLNHQITQVKQPNKNHFQDIHFNFYH